MAAEEREAKRAQERALRAAEAEIAKKRARLDREAAAAETQRQKAEARSQMARLKAETKALGQLEKLKGTSSPKPAPARGPAMLPGDPIIPAGVTVQKLGNNLMPPTPKLQGGFSSLPPGVYALPPSSCAAKAAGGAA